MCSRCVFFGGVDQTGDICCARGITGVFDDSKLCTEHKNRSGFKCSECGREFSTKDALNAHIDRGGCCDCN